MFTNGLKDLDLIPPIQHVVVQNKKWALLASAFIWRQSLSKTPQFPTYSDSEWEWNGKTNEWVPYWADLADVSQTCSLVFNCECVVACRGICKCHQAGIHCSQLCKIFLESVVHMSRSAISTDFICKAVSLEFRCLSEIMNICLTEKHHCFQKGWLGSMHLTVTQNT